MLRILLFPLSFVYRLAIGFRNFLYDSKLLRQHEFNVPIISVGNITVGGTGKTPHVEYLIELLSDRFNVAILSRGYKRKTRGFILATLQSGAEIIGDEPVQIKQKYPHVAVAVCENRVRGIKKLMATLDSKIDVIILDDAFQHRRVIANINIVLADYTRPVSDDLLLPAGRLREPVSALKRANIIVYTKCPRKLQPIEQRVIRNRLDIRPYQSLFFTSFAYGEITPAQKGKALFSDDLKHYTVLLVTGIANPKPMVEYLEGQVGKIIHKTFPDHYRFNIKVIRQLASEFTGLETEYKIIITTEKDLARIRFLQGLPDYFLDHLFYLPVKVKFIDRTKDQFNIKIRNYVSENKSNSRLYQR